LHDEINEDNAEPIRTFWLICYWYLQIYNQRSWKFLFRHCIIRQEVFNTDLVEVLLPPTSAFET